MQTGVGYQCVCVCIYVCNTVTMVSSFRLPRADAREKEETEDAGNGERKISRVLRYCVNDSPYCKRQLQHDPLILTLEQVLVTGELSR